MAKDELGPGHEKKREKMAKEFGHFSLPFEILLFLKRVFTVFMIKMPRF